MLHHVVCVAAGADPGFFLGGGALVSCSTSTPINHIVFFWRIPVVLENRRSSQEGGGVRTPCTLPLDPPLWMALMYCSYSTLKPWGIENLKSLPAPDPQVWIGLMLDSFALLLWSSLRSKRFRTVSKQTNDERESKTARKSGASKPGGGKKERNACRHIPGFRKQPTLALVPFFARPKPKNPVPRSFLAPKPNGNACQAG